MAIVEKRFRLLYSVLYAIYILFGISMTVVGATLPRILADFSWGYGGAGIVMAAGSIAYFVASYIAGKLIGPIGPKISLAIGGVLITIGLALFAATPSLALNALLYAAIGLGQGFIETNVNYAVVRLDKDGRALNLMHAAFSIGAVAGPFLIGFLMTAGLPWTIVYRAMAVLFVLIIAAVLALPFKDLPQGAAAGGAGARARGSAYVLGFVALFLYVGVELGISNWIAELFVRVFGSSEKVGSFMVSLFWLGLLAGRVGIPLAFPRAMPERTLALLSASLAVSAGLLAGCGFAGPAALPLAVAATTLAGLSCSAIYPIAITLVGRAYPEAQGEAIGFAATGGGVGSFLFVFLMSRIAKSFGLELGFAFYALVAVLMAAANFALSAATRARAAARGAGAPAAK
jgi:fucose permease